MKRNLRDTLALTAREHLPRELRLAAARRAADGDPDHRRALHLAIFAVAGPVAARIFPPDGPPRWVALFDHGLIDVIVTDLRTALTSRSGKLPGNPRL